MSESEETNTKTPQIFLKLSSPKHAPASHFMPSPREKRGGGAFRLQWLREEARAHDVGDMGRALRRIASGPNVVPWAAGNLLPALGMSRWRVRVDVSHDDEGDMLIGVCDAVGRNAWGLCLRSGKLNRVHRFAAHEAAQKRLKGLQALVVPSPVSTHHLRFREAQDGVRTPLRSGGLSRHDIKETGGQRARLAP